MKRLPAVGKLDHLIKKKTPLVWKRKKYNCKNCKQTSRVTQTIWGLSWTVSQTNERRKNKNSIKNSRSRDFLAKGPLALSYKYKLFERFTVLPKTFIQFWNKTQQKEKFSFLWSFSDNSSALKCNLDQKSYASIFIICKNCQKSFFLRESDQVFQFGGIKVFGFSYSLLCCL